MTVPIWQTLIAMTVYIVFLIFFIDIMRKHHKFASWFWLLSLLTIPLWLAGGVEGWFRWAKILSVVFPTIFLGFARLASADNRPGKIWDILRQRWVLWFLYGILFLNITEATLKDFQLGYTWNGIVGLLLCVTIPFADKYWKLDKDNKGDLVVYTSVAWNFIYTTWNLCFVYGEAGAFFASSICILFAAEIYPIIKRRPELYVISRVYTLAIHMLLRACFPTLFSTVMSAEGWFNAEVVVIWGLINLLLTIPFVFWHCWQLHTGKAEFSFKRIKNSQG